MIAKSLLTIPYACKKFSHSSNVYPVYTLYSLGHVSSFDVVVGFVEGKKRDTFNKSTDVLTLGC